MIAALLAVPLVLGALALRVHRFGRAAHPLPPRPLTAVVLGARVRADSSPSPALAARTALGVELLRQGHATHLLLTGGSPDARRPEAQVMLELARALGVGASRCTLEARSRSTWDNARECAALLRAGGARGTAEQSAAHEPQPFTQRGAAQLVSAHELQPFTPSGVEGPARNHAPGARTRGGRSGGPSTPLGVNGAGVPVSPSPPSVTAPEVLLVTSDFHLLRARAHFRCRGVGVWPVAVVTRLGPWPRLRVTLFEVLALLRRPWLLVR